MLNLSLVRKRMRRALPPCPTGGHLVQPNRLAGTCTSRPPPNVRWGVSTLSPMRLGPVEFDVEDPQFRSARTLEQLFQGAKVYPHEMWGYEGRFQTPSGKLDKYTVWDPRGVGSAVLPHPSPAFFDTFARLIAAPKPFRHKYGIKRRKDVRCAALRARDGRVHMYPYIEWRYIYCIWYEYLVEGKEEFRALEEAARLGVQLLITGYDAPNVPYGGLTQARALELYESPAHPFGHEPALACMLSMPREERPWHVWKDSHPGVHYPKEFLPPPMR